MATSDFFVILPGRLELTVSLPRNLNSFRDLADLSKGLDEVDRLWRKANRDIWPRYIHPSERRAFVTRFHVGSSPVFDVTTDPAWLMVFITILVSYKPAKENIREMISDAERFASTLEGLTEGQIRILTIGVQLYLEQLFERGEKVALRLAERLHRARARLIGEKDGAVRISIRNATKNPKLR